MNAPSNGIYYVAVFNPKLHENAHNHVHEHNGYAIIIGYVEEFTPLELILIPYRVHGIYVWEGQSQLIIFLPTLLVIIIGGVIAYRRSKREQHPRGLSKWLATFGGLAFLGTAAGTIYQIVFTFTRTGIAVEALITLAIVIVSIILALFALRYALRGKPKLTIWRRVGLLVIAIVALFAWSGLYLGPSLLIAAAIVPPYVKNMKRS
jgi:FtsH-binding integral membrane protein